MNILIYGYKGWLGNRLLDFINTNNIIKLDTRIDNYIQIENDIIKYNPDRIICCAGFVRGKEIKNQNFLEKSETLYQNINDNLYGPIILSTICNKYNIHLTYLGTAVFYDSNNEILFSEDDNINFLETKYSIVKSFTDRFMKLHKNTLNLRLSLPIDNIKDERNLITKLISFKYIVNHNVSITSIPHMFPILVDMINKKITGTFNFVNVGHINLFEIIKLYEQIFQCSLDYIVLNNHEEQNVFNVKRSYPCLNTEKIQKLYPNTLHIKECIIENITNYDQ